MAELLAEHKQYAEAREVFAKATKHCPDSVDLWLAYAELESTVQSTFTKARSILETARLKIPRTRGCGWRPCGWSSAQPTPKSRSS